MIYYVWLELYFFFFNVVYFFDMGKGKEETLVQKYML